ncbi:hypothetical protein RCH12_001849 [Cryobacterium sp. MP_3.1]|uniref:DUF2076 domain-containing protein n=1 Tax=Cryobacterium zongtaii TaxID=1259217 RepID=A0A2S3Z8N6_9MICO|nr:MULTISPECIES: hypothetical protein [Cryobacterium]MEC5184384.1 hypothetical protein [Cryobacterium sp. MP_3.1]POH61907.1 hypothetical protein C3B59_15150 [Cryobacterium zongtaii]
MGFLDRLLGRPEQPEPARTAPAPQRTDDEIAVERYRYLLRTAPPETIEQVHTEAFSKLTDEQRDLLFQQLTENAMEGERPANAEPATLARSATRAELRQPGTLDRVFGGDQAGGRQGPGFGSMLGASLLGTVAGYVVGSALVGAFLPDMGGEGDAAGDGGTDPGAETTADSGDSGGDFGGDSGGGFGGDSGGFGDFGGGGDFGGF